MSTVERAPRVRQELFPSDQRMIALPEGALPAVETIDRQVVSFRRPEDNFETAVLELPDGVSYDMDTHAAIQPHLPSWFTSVPFERMQEESLPPEALTALQYMARIEGYVCGGYLPQILRSPKLRADTKATDFAVNIWASEENGHSFALYAAIDLYHGRAKSTRTSDLDHRKMNKPYRERINEAVVNAASQLTGDLFTTAYSLIGYRNELMTLRGYASLRTKMNEGGEHPVLSPMLMQLMKEEKEHAKRYKEVVKEMLADNPYRQKIARKILKTWPGIVGEGFGGSDEANKVILYLFEDAAGRDMIGQVDKLVGELPGLADVTPSRHRLEIAIANQALNS